MSYLHSKQVYNINLKPNNIFQNQIGVVKIRDYIGNNFFKIFEKDEEIQDKGVQNDIYLDIMSLIKLVRVLVYDKNVKIEDKNSYRSFMNLLESFLGKKEIDFDKIL